MAQNLSKVLKLMLTCVIRRVLSSERWTCWNSWLFFLVLYRNKHNSRLPFTLRLLNFVYCIFILNWLPYVLKSAINALVVFKQMITAKHFHRALVTNKLNTNKRYFQWFSLPFKISKRIMWKKSKQKTVLVTRGSQEGLSPYKTSKLLMAFSGTNFLLCGTAYKTMLFSSIKG